MPKLIAKHLRPSFAQLALEESGQATSTIGLLRCRAKSEPKTIHNLWKLFRAVMNWNAQQNDEQPRKWYRNFRRFPKRTKIVYAG